MNRDAVRDRRSEDVGVPRPHEYEAKLACSRVRRSTSGGSWARRAIRGHPGVRHPEQPVWKCRHRPVRHHASLRVLDVGVRVAAIAAAPRAAVTTAAATCGPGQRDRPTASSRRAARAARAGRDDADLRRASRRRSLNNDCPAAGSPAGVISLTIEGTQTDGDGSGEPCHVLRAATRSARDAVARARRRRGRPRRSG